MRALDSGSCSVWVVGKPWEVTRWQFPTRRRAPVYLTMLGFAANALGVDAGGNAYVTGGNSVAKLNPAGTAFLYNVDLGEKVFPSAIAVDPSGRAFVAGFRPEEHGQEKNAVRPREDDERWHIATVYTLRLFELDPCVVPAVWRRAD